MSNPTQTAIHDAPPKDIHPGFWMTVFGAIVAVLAPLGGFLGASMTGGGTAPLTTRLANWLVIGLVIGGLGVLTAFIGGVKWFRATHE